MQPTPVILALCLVLSFPTARAAADHTLPPVLAQLYNATRHLVPPHPLPVDAMEAAWRANRHRMLAGNMTGTDHARYVSHNKAPIFIIGATKGLCVVWRDVA